MSSIFNSSSTAFSVSMASSDRFSTGLSGFSGALLSALVTAARKRRNAEEVVDEDAYTAPEGDAVYDDLQPGDEGEGQNEVFDDIDEDEFDEMRYGRTLGLKDILKVALIMVLAAALIVGGVMWFRHIRGNTSHAKIEGVSESLYNDGLAMIKSHAETPYINDLTNVFMTEGSIGLATRANADKQAIDALMPAEPAVNDALFIQAVQAIQSNIGNAVLADAQAASSGSGSGEAESAARWAIVNNSIAQLENASTAAELTAIINGDQVIVSAVEATPSPTPAATYEPLSKGMKSDAVLELQNRLYMLGFLTSDRDGDYGTKTQTAVKLFQSYVGLEPTGIADSETLARLYADDAPMTDYAQMTPPPAADTAAESTDTAAESADTDDSMLAEDAGLGDDTADADLAEPLG